MLHHYGFTTRSDVTSQFVGWDTIDDIGRADIFASRMNKPVFIEVKRGTDAFDLTSWRVPQRLWGQWVQSPPFKTPYWIFLTIGMHPPNYNPEKYKPRRSWLVPYDDMLDVESQVIGIQNRLVYQAGKGMRTEIQEQNLDAVTLLAEWELDWNGGSDLIKPSWAKSLKEMDTVVHYGGFWTIPEKHPFYAKFLSDIDNENMLKKSYNSAKRYYELLNEYKSQKVKEDSQKKPKRKIKRLKKSSRK